MRQPEPQEFFPRRFTLPFRNAAAFAIRIREATMLSNSETTAAQIRLMPARDAPVSGCSRRKSKLHFRPEK
jgi:hypothetical protein